MSALCVPPTLAAACSCRPCLPQELPPDPSGQRPAGEVPVAVISLGCHPSTDRDLSTRCELSGSSLVSGYSEAVKVFTMAGGWVRRGGRAGGCWRWRFV